MSDFCEGEGVGRGRPPKEHQFKKGQSGNPKGRPRRRLSVPEIVSKVRDEMLWMTIDGKRTKVTLVEAALRQNIANCFKSSNPTHLDKLLATLEKYGVTPSDVLRDMVDEGYERAQAKLRSLFLRTVICKDGESEADALERLEASKRDTEAREKAEVAILMDSAAWPKILELWRKQDADPTASQSHTRLRQQFETVRRQK